MITVNSSGNPISAGFITALTSDNRTYDAKLLLSGTELDCSITRLTITKGSCGSAEAFTIGNVVGSTLVAEVKGLSTAVKGQELEVRIGVSVNGSYEYVTLGYFVVSEAPQTAYATTITAYGATITRTGDAFTPPSTQTLANIASAISTSASALAGRTVNVTFENGIVTSDTITVPLNNLTVYQALQILASCVGGYAIDTYDGHIKICRFSDTATLSRDTSTMKNLPVVEEADFEINGVLCIVTPESQDDEGQVVPAIQFPTTPTGNENLVVQNQYMTQALYTSYLSTLAGYEYRPATIGLTYGDPRLEGNDVVQVTDINSNVYAVPCHLITHTYTGGFSSQIVAVTATPQNNDVATSAGNLTEQLSSIAQNTISARASAESAKASAESAQQSAQTAYEMASQVEGLAQQAQQDAQQASQSASEALTSAQNALTSAEQANGYATDALYQLGNVENVVGVFDWLKTHATYALSQDEVVDPTKWYFIHTADGYEVVTSPTGNPSTQGYYELVEVTEAVQEYVTAHLTVDAQGLWIQNLADSSSRFLVASDGAYIYGNNGQQLAKYGTDAVVGDPNGFHITISPTNHEIGFWRGTESNTQNKVAYVSENKLYITQSVVLQQMDVGTRVADGGLGQWSWKVHDIDGRNNLYLKWLG